MPDKIADFFRVIPSLTNEQIVRTVNQLEDFLYRRQNPGELCPECGHRPLHKVMSVSIDDTDWVCRSHGRLNIGKRGIFYRPHLCGCHNKCHNKGAK